MMTTEPEYDDDDDEEEKWTDAQIRWTQDDDDDDDDDGGVNHNNQGTETEEDCMMDPFADPNPYETFTFVFQIPPIPPMSSSSSSVVVNTNDGKDDDDNDRNSSNNNNNKCVDTTKTNTTKSITLELRGYKHDADQIWQSTGLTVWKQASQHLCQYMIQHVDDLFINNNNNTTNKPQQSQLRILELGAGLGLCGILAHWIAGPNTTVCITDGDTNALKLLKDNVRRNIMYHGSTRNAATTIPTGTTANDDEDGLEHHHNHNDDDDDDNDEYDNDHRTVMVRQLIWGDATTKRFLRQQPSSSSSSNEQQQSQEQRTKTTNQDAQDASSSFELLYDVILASDIVYSNVIVRPLWETIRLLLRRSSTSIFVLSYTHRTHIPVTFDMVLKASEQAGFVHEVVDTSTNSELSNNNDGRKTNEEEETSSWVYAFRWKKQQ